MLHSCMRCLGAVGSGSPAERCHTASGQLAVESLQNTAALPGDSGHWNSYGTVPHCLGAVASGSSAAESVV